MTPADVKRASDLLSVRDQWLGCQSMFKAKETSSRFLVEGRGIGREGRLERGAPFTEAEAKEFVKSRIAAIDAELARLGVTS